MFEFDLPESGHGFEADPLMDPALFEDPYQWDRFDED